MFWKKKKEKPMPKEIKGTIISREYKIYLKEEQWAGRIATIYEKMAKASRKILDVQPGEKLGKKLQDAIDFAHLNMEPADASSFAAVIGIFGVLFFSVLIFFRMIGLPGLDFALGILAIALLMPFTYLMLTYPVHLKKRFEVKTGSEIVTMILYMAIYLRDNPNMEGALRFAADNLTGPLAYELRKLIWDIEIGRMSSVDAALMEYSAKWSGYTAFIESLQTMRESLRVSEEKRQAMLDESVNNILKSTSERADRYNRSLKMPIMAVHAMGIVLPIMGLVLFPVISIFLDVPPIALFIGYDIILPLVLLFLVFHIMETRPPTFSTISVENNPEAAPSGKIAIKGKRGLKFISAMPIALITAAIPIALGMYMFMAAAGTSDDLMASVFVVAGLAAGLSVYYLGVSQYNLKIRKTTRTIEEEFRDALFRLGNEISGGRPIETALERSLNQMGDSKIKGMFRRAMDNIKNMGMTFSAAFFDRTYGAVRFYPSNLIRSIMKTIVESTKKGLLTASSAMLSISDFLNRMHSTQIKVEENMSDVASSMQFQAFFLSPLVSGIVVTMAIIVIKIIEQIGPQLSAGSMGGSSIGGVGVGFLSGIWSNVPITPGIFQLIVGIYMIESAIIISMFINGIKNGEDPIGLNDLIGSVLLIGTIVYIVTLFVTMMIFGPMIAGVL